MKAVSGRMVRTIFSAAITVAVATASFAGENQWTPIGPEGGVINAVTVSGETSATIFAGSDTGGVYRSDDRGNSWRIFSDGIGIKRIVALTPTNGGLFAATSNALFRYTTGETWSASSVGIPSSLTITSLAAPGSGTVLLAGTTGGPYLSTNGGGSWESVAAGMTNTIVRAVAFDPVEPTTMYAATEGGIYRLRSGESAWSAKNTGLTSTVVYALTATQDAGLLAGTAAGLFKISDAGDTWVDVGDPFAGHAVTKILRDKRAPDVIFAVLSDGTAYRSADGGGSWNKIEIADKVRTLAGSPESAAVIVAGTPTGIFISENSGETWLAAASGIRDSRVFTLGVTGTVEAPVVLAALSSGKTLRKNDTGTWAELPLASPVNAFAIASPTSIYAGTTNDLKVSNDGGDTWSAFSNGTPGTGVTALLIDPVTPGTLYAGTAGSLYKRQANDDTWAASNMGLNSKNIASIVSTPDASKIFAGAFAPEAEGGGVYRSTDGGASWTKTSAGLTNMYVRTLLVVPEAPTTIIAGTAGGIFRSTDSGATWTRAAGATFSTVSVAATPGSPASLIAGTTDGVYRSLDGGATWSRTSSGMPSVAINAVAVGSSPTTPVLYAATEGAGIFTATITDTTPPAATAAPGGGTYGVPQVVTLSSDEEATIFYTLNGSAPTPASPKYQSPLSIWTASKTTLKFFAIDKWGNVGETKTEEYVFDTTPPKLTLNGFAPYTNQSFLELTGTTEEGATVSVATDTAASDGAATVSGTDWSYRINDLPAGETAITVTATDAAGNSSVITTKINVVPGLGKTHFLITPRLRTDGGKIEPSEPVVVEKNGSQTFTFVAEEGYHLEAAGVNNWAVSTRNNTYTAKKVRKNLLLEAVFELNEYRITAKAGKGGAVRVLTKTVEHGEDGEVLITAKKGWEIDTVTVDNEPQEGPFASPFTLTIPDVTGNRKVVATFRKAPAPQN